MGKDKLIVLINIKDLSTVKIANHELPQGEVLTFLVLSKKHFNTKTYANLKYYIMEKRRI